MSKNQNCFLIVILILIVIVSGCIDNRDISSAVKSMPEVQQFMKEHPDAKISVTYWSKEEVIQASQEISDDCGKNIIPSAMYKAIISESNERIISWINAENKMVICTTTQGNDNSKITTSSTSPPVSSERNEDPNPTIPAYSVSTPTTRQTTDTEISPPPTITDSESTLTPEKTPFEFSTPSIIVATPTVSITSVQTPISTVSPSISGTTLSLKPGWNLISSSITEGVDLSTIEKSCTILQYKKQKLWEWNAQAQSWTNPDYLGPFKGYWIYAADTCNVPLSGTPAIFTTLPLYKGWNKISAKGSLPAISGTCTGHIDKNWIWNWDKKTEKWTHPATMQLDKGYWIKVDQDCTLGGQVPTKTVTPIVTSTVIQTPSAPPSVT